MTKPIQALDYETLIETLKKQSYIDVPFPCSACQIQEAMEAFFAFLNEPEEVKHHINFTIAKQHRRGDVGFRHRNASDDLYRDNKDFFHYHPALFKHYGDFVEAHPVLKSFVTKAQVIWEEVNHIVKQLMKILDSHHPGLMGHIYNTEDPHILLRFLKYEWETSGHNLAKPHYDAGSFTLAIAESCEGLRIGSRPENLKLVKHQPGHALFMLSSNFRKIMDRADLEPAWHDVIQMDATQMGKPYARWAMVAFIEHDGEALPRSETHKWATEVA